MPTHGSNSLLKLLHRSHRLLDRRLPIHPMQIIKVNIIRLESLQALLTGSLTVLCIGSEIVPRREIEPEFRGEKDLFAIACLFEPLP